MSELRAAGRQWIFGYGSLVDAERLSSDLAMHGLGLGDYRYCDLMGFKRTWSVAMDNTIDEPGYKYYVDAHTGLRPDVYVAFVNIEAHAGPSPGGVAGILFEVDATGLHVLDQRERNYQRCDVTPSISAAVDGTVWTYVGHAQAHARYQHGLATDRLVIDDAYRQTVETAYAHARLPYAAEMHPKIRALTLNRVDT